mgnify:CR=1 FL=1
MQEKNTDPVLQTIFLIGIKTWREMKEINIEEFPKEYQELLEQQETIGWRQVWNGRWDRLLYK